MKYFSFYILLFSSIFFSKAQECKCRLMYSYFDSVSRGYGSVAVQYEYLYDSLLIVRKGFLPVNKELEIKFEDFDEIQARRDSFWLKNGEFYYSFQNKRYLFLSPANFKKGKNGIMYKIGINHSDTNFTVVSKIVYKPLGIKFIEGKKYFSYKTYSSYLFIRPSDISYEKISNMKESISTRRHNRFVIDEHSYSTIFFTPELGEQIIFSGLSRQYISKYIESECCIQILRELFKTWD